MKTNRTFKFIGILVLFIFIFSSCAKDPDEPEEETPTTPVASAKLTWSVNGSTAVNSDDSFYVPAYNEIFGNKNGLTVIDIILDTLSKGSHAISPSHGITLDYTDASNNTHTANAGSVVITEFSGNRMSGTYNCSVADGGTVTSIKGEFSNVPKK